ncbi:MAG TPA: tail fiber protein [Pyrinomonadaceae bacterium]|nr:tail fiber protein [Pyrinomonadaceae bacterium]
MAEPFLAEIRIFSFGFAPKGWALCNGQLLPINQNQALFSLLGTTFGGDGRVNFGLPNLQGMTPIHVGNGHTLGEKGGEQAHTLNTAQLPTHVHSTTASSTLAALGTGNTPNNTKILGGARSSFLYGPATGLVGMDPREISTVGGNQAHLNMQPFLVLNFSIALQGVFPSPN